MGSRAKPRLRFFPALAVLLPLVDACGGRTGLESKKQLHGDAPSCSRAQASLHRDHAATLGQPGCLEREDCELPECEEGSETSISGLILDPAGRLPVYNALVYVPGKELTPFDACVTCERCGGLPSGSPMVIAQTDPEGRFVLNNTPSGNVPIVVQLGKWRRHSVIQVESCTNNIADEGAVRLPRNKVEGELPRIAVTTGQADALECLLLRIGIDPSEFTTFEDDGSVHLYAGGDPSVPIDDYWSGVGAVQFEDGREIPPAADNLWAEIDRLLDYDMLLLSCEGSELRDFKARYHQAFESYVDAGGRAFLSHAHFGWLRRFPPFSETAEFIGIGEDLADGVHGTIVDSFPKGVALSRWLDAVGAATLGQLQIVDGQHSVAQVHSPAQAWVQVDAELTYEGTVATQYTTFNTPVEQPPDDQCGRLGLMDLHTKRLVYGPDGEPTGGDDSAQWEPFPTGCSSRGWSPQAALAAFALFDLAGCIQPDAEQPKAPVP